MTDYEKKRREILGLDGGSGTSNKQPKTTTQPEKKTTTSSNANDQINRRREILGLDRIADVDDNFISSFLSDANSFLSKTKDKIGWGNAASSYETKYKAWSDLESRHSELKNWLRHSGDRLDEETYSSISSMLDTFWSNGRSYMNWLKETKDYYSQWDSEEAYNKYQQEQKEYTEKLNFDTDAGQKEIDSLWDFYDSAFGIEQWYNEYTTSGKTNRLDPDEDARNLGVYNELVSKYGSAEDLKKLIQEKERYLVEAKRLQHGLQLSSVSGNADFGDYKDYVSTELDGWWEKLGSEYGMDYGDLTYEYINNQNNIREEIQRKYAIMKGDSYTYDGETPFEKKGYDFIHDDEVAIYNYYYAKYGKKKAEEYLDSIAETLSYRKATEMYGKLEDKALLELAFGVAAGVDQFSSGVDGLLNAVTGNEEYVPATATQMASGMVREDLGDVGPKLPKWLGGSSLGQVGYDTVTTTSNMIPSIMTSTALNLVAPGVGSAAGSIMLGASAAGNAYQEMINLGYNKDQARMYSALVGGSEAGLQYLLGGIGALGGEVSGNVITKLMAGVDNAFARVAIQLAGNMVSEGFEEGLQEILTPWFKNLALNADESVDWSEVAYSTLLGALTAGFMEGGGTVSGEVNTYKTGRQLQNAGITAQRLSELGATFSADTVAYQLAGRVNENTGAYTMGRLFNEIGATLSEQNITEITRALAAKGIDYDTARENAEALAYVVAGGQLTEKQAAIIEANKVLADAAKAALIDSNTSWKQRTGSYNEVKRAVDSARPSALEAAQLPQETAEVAGEQVVTQVPKAAQPSQVAPVEAPAANEQQVAGKLTGKESLQVTEESSVAQEPEQESVTLEKASEKYGAQAQAMIHTYVSGQDVAKYDQGYQAAYDMGKSGVNIDYALKSPATAYLNERQRSLAYEAGEAAANTTAHSRAAEIEAAANGKTGHRKGGLVRGEGVTIADLKKAVGDSRGTAYKTISTIAKVTGIDIVLYKSEPDSSGTFRDAQGKYRRSEPGTLYIDINAGLASVKDVGDLAKYTTLRTFSHEFTHFIENWNPVQYNEFRKVVFDTLTQQGEDVEFLIEQRRKAGLDYEAASREVVAEAMTDILPDSTFVETLANEHKTIFQKLLDKLKEFTAKLRDYFNSLGSNRSREVNALKEQVGDTVKYLDSIVKLFDSVAVEAVRNYQLTVAAEEVAVSEMESTTEDSQAEDAVAYKNEKIDDVTLSETETVEAHNADEVSDNTQEDSNNETVAAETEAVAENATTEEIEAPAEETAIPPKAETEEAKQDLRKAVRMPIQGTNMEALLEGIKNRELSLASVTLSGSVDGFNAEQRHHLVEKLLEGVYTDSETIKIEVPYDGKFEIVNTPGNVAKVLENLKVKARQEAIFDKKTISLLTSNGHVRIVDVGGRKYLSNSYVMLPATEAAVEYAKAELDGKENQLHPEVAKAFENANNPLVDAPTEAKLDKTPVLIFSVDGKKLFFDKRLFGPLDGGQLYYADIRGAGILKSVDSSGNVIGYLMGIRPSGKSPITGEKPSNLKSYARKKVQEVVQKEKPASKPKSEPKTKAAPKAPPKVTEAKATKPATVETSVKLEDFGQKIGGARKDQWSKRGLLAEDLDAMNDREREKNVKKDNVWKRPDYRKLIEGGADRNILFVRNEIRKALNQNIAYPYRVSDARKKQMQEEFVATVRAIQEMAEKVTTKAELAAMGRPWLIEHGYRTENSFTDKWRRNAALQGTNYVQTIEHLVRNWDQLSKLADKANFAVDAEKKIPSGFSIHEDDSNHTWFIARGNWVVRHSIPSYDEALNYLRNAASNTIKKTRFVPEQLVEVHRKGPDYRGSRDVKGQDYLDTFGFKGGEFGNWMTEKDRRVSMNYGFDALKDLADALGIVDQDISLAGNLSIAFGARGQGLSGAAAHYEQERHVINLTKMNGAGSLAHEWFHALDDFLGGYGSKFATEYGSQLPETTKAAVRHLLTTMQYRDATQEETDMAATKAYEQARRSVTYQVANQFGWVRRIEEGKFQESDARYYSKTPTEADVKKYHELLDKLLETGDMAALEELSALRKEVAGHVIPKEDRESIGYHLSSLRSDATKNVQKMRLRSDFYNNSRRFGELHHKDGDYWDSTIEMAARAFACYVADKTGKHNDYLSAHSDTAVTLDMDKDGNVSVVRAFPVGEERAQINAAFDRLITALKADGFLHEQGEAVKPEMIQYQRRSNSEDVQNPYDGKSLYGDEEIYHYDFMTAQPDMAVVEMPSLSDVKSGNKVDQKKAVELGLSNAMGLGRQVGENQYAIRNAYTGREIIVGTSGLSHGLSGENVNRLRTNARLAAVGGTIVQNAIPINGLKNKNRQASGTYAMACLLNSGDYHVVAIVTVEEHTSKAVGIDYVDITHSINGRILEKNIDSRSSTREMGYGQESAPTTAIYKVSIADLLDIVNKTHRSILSDDVLKFFNEERPDGGFYSDRVLHQERTSPLTDRDILAIAEKRGITEALSAGQVSALQIFNKKNAEIGELLKQKAKLEKLLKDLQGAAKPNKSEIIKTRNRIKIVESQIDSKSAQLRQYEAFDTVKDILAKVKPMVEQRLIEERKKELAKYATIPQGEKTVRESNLPSTTDGKNKVSRTARTVKEARVTPDDVAELIDKEVYLKGGLSYLPVSNNDATQKAIDIVTEEGWEATRGAWSAEVRRGKVSAELSAMGALLLNNAARAGDKQTWLDVLHDYQIMSTNAGQAVQALRILKTLSPDDKLYMVHKSINRMVKDLRLKRKIQIDAELEAEYLAAETDEARDDIMAQIQQNIADQIPATFMDKWTSLRYLNMLGNLRTQVRNLAGNAVMGVTVETKNLVATGLEAIFSICTGGKYQKSKALFASKDLMKAAFADYAMVKSIISNGGKYNDQLARSSDFAQGVMEKRKIFKSKALEKYRKATNWAMENGDIPFSKYAYARALAGYLKQHGFNGSDLSKAGAKLIEDARQYAVQEAQEATFHDLNMLSKWVTKVGRRKDTPALVRGIADGVAPFRQTPANIAVRAEEYSLLGIVNSLYYTVQAARETSDITPAQAINSWAKTITGSALFFVGWALAASGVLIGGPDDDEDRDRFAQMYGQQNYALRFGDTYITIDWASPAAIPMLMGAQFYRLKEENGFQFKDITGALSSLADPLIQMSMLQGINDTLEKVKYSDNNLIQIAINSSLNYLTQGLTNSLLGQLERSFEDSRMSTYVDKNSQIPDWLQQLLGKASAKIPGWDYNQIPHINAWGEEQENPDLTVNAIYNMLSPSYISKGTQDAVYEELIRLDDAQSDKNVIPNTPEKEYEGRHLSADEYVALAKSQGQTQRKLVEEIIATEEYQTMNDTNKAKTISFAYKYAKEKAQIEVLGREAFSAKWLNEIKGDPVPAIIQHVLEQ